MKRLLLIISLLLLFVGSYASAPVAAQPVNKFCPAPDQRCITPKPPTPPPPVPSAFVVR